MKLLIEIPDEDYYDLIEKSKQYPIDMFTKAQSSIINGKPLDDVLGEIQAEINKESAKSFKSPNWERAKSTGMGYSGYRQVQGRKRG